MKQKMIAQEIGVHPSTISRELNRNIAKNCYCAIVHKNNGFVHPNRATDSKICQFSIRLFDLVKSNRRIAGTIQQF